MKKGLNIVEKYDRQSLYPMLLKCYHYLHPKTKSKVGCAYQIKDTKFDLNIFEQTRSPSEPTIELVIREMLIFRCYQVDSKNIKHLFQWWAKHEAMFLNVGFLTWQILKIIGSQIEIEKIFSLAWIFTNLRKCCLRSENLERLIFVNKNWLNDPIIDWKPPSNLVELIENNLDFEELEKFEGYFERDELLDI